MNNLMLYSKGECIPRIIPKYGKHIEEGSGWLPILQNRWEKFLKTKDTDTFIDFTMVPFGNINKEIRLVSNDKGELMIIDDIREPCF